METESFSPFPKASDAPVFQVFAAAPHHGDRQRACNMSNTLTSFDLEQHQAQPVLSRLWMQQYKECSSSAETQGTRTVGQDLVDGGY